MSAPRDPEGAFLLGTLYVHAGGKLLILSNGQRVTSCDLDDDKGDLLRVRIMLEGLLKRLHPEDKNFLFDALGEVVIDPTTITSATDEPLRRNA